MRRHTRVAGPFLLLILLTAASAAAETGAERAGRFVRLLLDGESAAVHELMTPQMQAAFGAAQQAQLIARLVAQNGAAGGLGEAWLKDTVQGYRRYHVPVRFAKATLDLMVVIDGSGLVGGLFVVPHVERKPAAGEDAELPEDTGAGAPGREVEVALDVVTGLGEFVELELVTDEDDLAAAGQAINDLAAELALSEPERRSYLELLMGD